MPRFIHIRNCGPVILAFLLLCLHVRAVDGAIYPFTSFSTHLPLLVLEIHGYAQDARADVMMAEVRLVDNPGGVNRLQDPPVFQSRVWVRRPAGHPVAGQKSGYIIGLPGEGRDTRSHSILGMGASDVWTLLGSSTDRMMLRTAVAFELAKAVTPGIAPEARYCEAFVVKDGRIDYQGLHLLTGRMEDGVSLSPKAVIRRRYITRCDISGAEQRDTNDDLAWRRPFSHGYTIPVFFGKKMDVKAVDEIDAELLTVENTLASDNPIAFFSHLSLLDAASFVNAYILNGVMENRGINQPFAFEKRDGVIGLLPLWDFGDALDNAREAATGNDFLSGGYAWMDRLCLSAGFMEQLRNRYYGLVRNELKPARIDALVDSLYLRLGNAAERDWERWRSVYGQVSSPERRVDSPEQEVVGIKHRLRLQGSAMRTYLKETAWIRYQFDYDMDSRRNFFMASAFIIAFFALTRYSRRRVR